MRTKFLREVTCQFHLADLKRNVRFWNRSNDGPTFVALQISNVSAIDNNETPAALGLPTPCVE